MSGLYQPKVYRKQGGAELVVAAGGLITVEEGGQLAIAGELSIDVESDVTGENVEPLTMTTTLTGVGAVGGRAKFKLESNVALGGWANALKALTEFGASGRITGLASGFCAELSLSPGCTQGHYAALEAEIVMQENGVCGGAASFLYGNITGDGEAEFNDNGYLFELGTGIDIDTGHMVAASVKDGVKSTHSLRILIADTPYYIPLSTAQDFNT